MKQGVLILCGGKSSRMGSDKGLLEFRGHTLIEHVLKAVSALEIPIVLVGKPQLYARFGYPVVQDEVAEQGPMRGILSGMKSVEWDRALVLSCDAPFVSTELLRHLLEEMGTFDAIIPETDGKFHPLIGAYSCHIQATIETLLSEKIFRMSALLDAVNSRILDLSNHPEFADEKLYVNLNTPDEVKLWE